MYILFAKSNSQEDSESIVKSLGSLRDIEPRDLFYLFDNKSPVITFYSMIANTHARKYKYAWERTKYFKNFGDILTAVIELINNTCDDNIGIADLNKGSFEVKRKVDKKTLLEYLNQYLTSVNEENIYKVLSKAINLSSNEIDSELLKIPN